MRPSPTALLLMLAALAAPEVQAQQLVYQPRNPSFGGFPSNYQYLFGLAQAQNDYEEPGRLLRDPLADFEQNLQRQVLSQLSREIVADRFGDVDLTQEGRYDFGDFQIEVVPGLSEITIRIFNVLTGDESTVRIPASP